MRRISCYLPRTNIMQIFKDGGFSKMAATRTPGALTRATARWVFTELKSIKSLMD